MPRVIFYHQPMTHSLTIIGFSWSLF